MIPFISEFVSFSPSYFRFRSPTNQLTESSCRLRMQMEMARERFPISLTYSADSVAEH